MNTIIPISFFLIFIILAVLGLIYTVRNNENLSKELDNDKLIAQFNNIEIRDTEAFGINYWSGKMSIYENKIIIENSSYSHHFIKKNVSHNKIPMTIILNDCYIDKDHLILTGTKHRVLHNSSIEVKLKAKSTDSLMKMKELIN